MDKLIKYIADKYPNRGGKGEFAKAVGLSPSELSDLLKGRRKPVLKDAVRIQKFTQDAVPVTAWIVD